MCGHNSLFNITCLMLRYSVLIFITLSHEYDQQYLYKNIRHTCTVKPTLKCTSIR